MLWAALTPGMTLTLDPAKSKAGMQHFMTGLFQLSRPFQCILRNGLFMLL